MINFKTWISQFSEENSSIGNLAREIKYDDNFPIAVGRKPLILHFIKKKSQLETIYAFEDAYKLYKSFKQDNLKSKSKKMLKKKQ